MAKAIYAFSGDPITFGHMDVINRASKVFDHLIVGIGVNPDKKYMFSLEDRMNMAKKAVAKNKNVEIVQFSGLLVDYAFQKGVDVIVKGVRDVKDLEYERVLAQAGETQVEGIDTHLLFAKPEHQHVSSSVVKALQKENGDISKYVPVFVKQKLEEKISGQYVVGITGGIACGKSFVSEQFVEYGKQSGVEVHNIDFDKIGHDVIGKSNEPAYEKVKKNIINYFGEDIKNSDGSINRNSLGKIVFGDKTKLQALEEMMWPAMMVKLRQEMYGKKGIILLNAALIAEKNLGYLSNNNVVLVDADKDTQIKRMMSRDYSADEVKKRLDNQYTNQQKKEILERAIEKDDSGKVWVINNSEGAGIDYLQCKFKEILSDIEYKI